MTSTLQQREPMQNGRFVDRTGKKYGPFEAIEFVGFKGRLSIWKFRCECGREIEHSGAHVACETSRPACPCQKAPEKPPEYYAWKRLGQRQWCDFEQFFAEMGEAPEGKGYVCLIDSERGYCTGNCRWGARNEVATFAKQRLYTHNGETLNIADWARRLGLSRERMRQRFNKFSVEEALSAPKGTTCRERTKRERPMKEQLKATFAEVDALIDTAVLKTGEAINCSSTKSKIDKIRTKLLTRAKARGVNVTTRTHDDQSFWLIAWPNKESESQEAPCSQ